MKLKSLYLGGLFAIGSMVLTVGCKPKIKPPVEEEKKFFVYELVQPENVTLENFKMRAAAYFGENNLPGEFVADEESGQFLYKDDDPSVYITQDVESGNFYFGKSLRDYYGNARPDLPSADDALGLAREFLKSSKLYPGNPGELHLVHSGGLRADSPDGNDIIDKLRTLTFGRLVDSLPVIGSGSRIMVHVGHKGSVHGLSFKWREISTASTAKREIKPEEMKSEAEATEEVKRLIAVQFGKNSEFIINKIHKVYYHGNGRLIQPVYAFETTVSVQLNEKVRNETPYLSILPALKNPPEEVELTRVDEEASKLIIRTKMDDGKPNPRGEMD